MSNDQDKKTQKNDPVKTSRNDPQLAYEAFMSMGEREWMGAMASIAFGNGCFEPAENEGFKRAMQDRKKIMQSD